VDHGVGWGGLTVSVCQEVWIRGWLGEIGKETGGLFGGFGSFGEFRSELPVLWRFITVVGSRSSKSW